MSAFHPLLTLEHVNRLRAMRSGVIVPAICASTSCRNAEPNHAPETDQTRTERQYATWAARQPRPPAQLVDQIEALLARQPCVGKLKQWSRYYAYNRLPEKTVDKGIVDFHLEEAGRLGVKAGRQITEPDSWVNIDDRPIKMASGDYDLKDNRIRFAFCGNNFGVRGTGGIDNMNAYYEELKRRRLAQDS